MNPSFEDIYDDADRGLKDVGHDRDADLGPMDIQEDNEHPVSPQAGQKHPRRDYVHPNFNGYRKAIKVKNSKGRPKADDWEPDVQEILAKAILFYELRLATEGLFPDHMQEVAWSKVAWLDGCTDCGLKIHHNSEIIKIVSFF